MTAITQPENGVLQHDAISLPLLRPVSKPPSAPVLPPYANGVAHAPAPAPAPAPSSPPTVQSVQKLNLDLLGNGDKVVVKTANSTYNFEMADHHLCKVIPSKSTARTGAAILMGGTNTDASEYSPNRILVGGRAAYQFADEDTAILTSAVESIFWVAARKPALA
ncbi:MAG: hypothetical protein NTV93_14295 [Verrucomicrobia bacterium]|nr:hypothetical protein [Verrucomicrobiota bacterium]